ncbi:TfpX/TfpZ family type IV pilin accessory protein [Ramlibacter tataouinensis]|uniref:Fimbrial assembly protein-like protein n=1 Tax=Ramlibacter tataouinensis (strain ATCC BAA-407 / DSM 14655 / LMG 21543 / TTB310) TaxID=365046 RepID=F5Y278_RAMTT|nr:TfpX/TfpZ family type IV pilin accessory protein [Ramlibacter tataouinensis]AEG94846.1 fimbrial assembly protein-like protein [Ramlibacter tataouinensis TTB310]
MEEAFVISGHHKPAFKWRARARAMAIHLAISAAVAALAAMFVFGLWYPYPYREISGGRELFLLLVTVDVILGPLITFAIFNQAKPRAELRRDLTVVGLLQLAALAYGLWIVAIARPVHLVFEIDRYRVVHAIDVPAELLPSSPDKVVSFSWTGPKLMAVRPFASEEEKMEATMAALQGVDLGARPDLWEPYEQAQPRVLAASKPVTDLLGRFPAHAAEIDKVLGRMNRPAAGVSYLPMVGRKSFWTVLVDARTAEVLAYLPIDSF